MNRRASRRSVALAALCAAEAYGVSVAARAQGTVGPPATAEVLVADCQAAALDARAVFSVLELELSIDGVGRIILGPAHDGHDGHDGQAGEDVAVIEVTLDCRPDASEVQLRARHSAHASSQRAMDISDLPRRLRARAVALAAAELARSLWLHARSPVEDERAASPAGETAEAAQPRREPVTIDNPPSPRPAAEQATRRTEESAESRAQRRPDGRRLGFGAGPATRWLSSASSPMFGGRAALRLGRWQVGADLLCSHDSPFATATELGLTLGWAAFDLLAIERGAWRFSTGPRVSAGAGWSRRLPGEPSFPQGGPAPSSPPGSGSAETTRGLFFEGAGMAQLQAGTRTGWLLAVGVEVGLGWGIAPGGKDLQPSPRASIGASLMAGHAF